MSISEHKHMPEPVRRIEVFTGAGRRRSWSAAEKAAIIAESYAAGDTVCAAATNAETNPATIISRSCARSSRCWPAEPNVSIEKIKIDKNRPTRNEVLMRQPAQA